MQSLMVMLFAMDLYNITRATIEPATLGLPAELYRHKATEDEIYNMKFLLMATFADTEHRT